MAVTHRRFNTNTKQQQPLARGTLRHVTVINAVSRKSIFDIRERIPLRTRH